MRENHTQHDGFTLGLCSCILQSLQQNRHELCELIKIGNRKGENRNGAKKVLVGLMIGCFFLVGTSSGMAAMWDRHCQVAIEDLQRLLQEISVKKQEVDAARVVQAIPSNFVFG